MPNLTIKQQRNEAVELHQIISGMSGPAAFKACRQAVQSAIEKIWPEAGTGEETPANEVRPIEIDTRQQRALAEGFLSMANNPATNGHDYKKLQDIARKCRLWGWVEKHIQNSPVPDFDGELDGEPALVDEELESAKKE